MKKLVSVLLILGSGLLLASCSSQANSDYQDAMTQAKSAVDKGNYSTAQAQYNKALTAKKSDQTAQTSLKQVKLMRTADTDVQQAKKSAAKEKLQQVAATEHGNSTLVKQAKTLRAKLPTVIKQQKNYQHELAQARSLSDNGNFVGSNAAIRKLLAKKSINQTYYTTVRSTARGIRSSNNASISSQKRTATQNSQQPTIAKP
ncbi:hypothetical protein AYR54_00475 [Loigolactobacillus backii]|uniref:Uncharacterized protein n=1 Tax=Loigolactobacillus backii TaxID=375175 RepID=A0A192GY74_9LACO|nr:hypothetical protein [Loigolactobacillus backii]ANK58871.1 hypothetical protein AYR52_00480 [Loigolactobacillus backii]ANK61464.1 hypothetical protein AYR53_01020 [Loigolactobacillus backii]ANK63861.1 hypothetical protein AYR54_00475 [Loigolactobacillus backii]ANK66309.1 hypothetical protein AYR55_00475 [Loigolactobacillus backii]ANK69337.1 hypothetical protein AYR56_03695 [Loigolactobacillus backii]